MPKERCCQHRSCCRAGRLELKHVTVFAHRQCALQEWSIAVHRQADKSLCMGRDAGCRILTCSSCCGGRSGSGGCASANWVSSRLTIRGEAMLGRVNACSNQNALLTRRIGRQSPNRRHVKVRALLSARGQHVSAACARPPCD